MLGKFCDYFPEENMRQEDWIRNPFRVRTASVTSPSNEEDQLAELSLDGGLSMPGNDAATVLVQRSGRVSCSRLSCYRSALPICVKVVSLLRPC